MSKKRLLTLLAILLIGYCLLARAVSALGQSGLGQVQYPSALDDPTTLFNLANNAGTYVARTTGSSDATLYVGSTSAFPSAGAVAIGTFNSFRPEIVFYSGKTANSFTGCVRGQDGSVASSHAIGESVSLRIDAVHINNLNSAVIALESKLGYGSSSPASGSILIGAAGGASGWTVPGASQVASWLGFTPVNKAGDTMTGSLILAADPAAALEAATKQYVDAHSGVSSFNTRAGAISLSAGDITAALGYSPQTPLTFAGQIQNSSGVVSCPTCENQSNKNIGNGYAGLTSAAKLPVSLGQEVWGVADLTDYSGASGSGSTAIKATITSPAINDVLTWNGSNWINQAPSGGGGGGGYATIAEEGVGLTQRTVLNLIGGAVTAADNSGAGRTDVTLSQSPSTSTTLVGVDRLIATGTGLTGGGDLSANRTLSVLPNSTNQQLQFLNNSASLIGTRHALQLLSGGALSWTLTDDGTNDKLTVQPVLSTSPGASGTLVGTGRLLNTTAPLSGGGDLSADRTLSLGGLSGFGTANQIPASAGSGWQYLTLAGTANQVNLSFGSGTLTFSLPQSIDSGSSPTWAGVNITGTTGLVLGSSTAISGTNSISLLVSSASSKPQLRYLSTGTGTGKWQFSNDGATFSDFGSGGGGGITSLNGLTASSQSFATGTSGTDFNISSSAGVHTFNIPDASATARGLINTGSQTIGGSKTFSGNLTFSGAAVSGGASLLNLTPGNHTNVSSNASDILYHGPTITASSNISEIDSWLLNPPTIAGSAATKTITTASTLTIAGAPIPGANAAIANGYSFFVQGGDARFNGRILVSGNGADPTQIPGQGGTYTVGINFNGTYSTSNGLMGVGGAVTNGGSGPAVGVMGAGIGTGSGSRVWGGNFYAYNNNATSFAQGCEIDVGNTVTNSSGGFGLSINVVQAFSFNGPAINISTLTNGGTFRNGIEFNVGGGGIQPFASTAALIKASSSLNVASGIDFTSATFSGNAIITPGFSVDGSGSVSTAARYYISAVEASNSTTTDLPASHAVSVYSKGSKIVIAYNQSGTIHYLTAPINGATGTVTWNDSTTGP